MLNNDGNDDTYFILIMCILIFNDMHNTRVWISRRVCLFSCRRVGLITRRALSTRLNNGVYNLTALLYNQN